MTLSAGNRNKQDDTHLPGVRASAFVQTVSRSKLLSYKTVNKVYFRKDYFPVNFYNDTKVTMVPKLWGWPH